MSRDIIFDNPSNYSRRRPECWTHKVCELCNCNFWVRNNTLKQKKIRRYCSKDCILKHLNKPITQPCGWCKKETTTPYRDYKNSKSGHIFCNNSCAASYNNRHRDYSRRSKVEVWVEQQISKTYPLLVAEYNNKTAIGSELDIYFPELQLAIELNGIFHYEPVFGKHQLERSKAHDRYKLDKCREQEIDLAVIDISWFSYFNDKIQKKLWPVIKEIIESKL